MECNIILKQSDHENEFSESDCFKIKCQASPAAKFNNHSNILITTKVRYAVSLKIFGAAFLKVAVPSRTERQRRELTDGGP